MKTKEKISSLSSEYQHKRELEREIGAEQPEDSFGNDVVEKIHALEKKTKLLGKEPTAQEKERAKEALLELKKRLGQKLEVFNWDSRMYALNFLKESLKNESVSNKLKQYITPQDTARTDYESLANLAPLIEKIPDDIFISMIEVHRDNFSKKIAEFNERLPEMQNKFIKGIKKLNQSYKLGLDEKIIESRQKETKIKLKDPLLLRLTESLGEYWIEAGTIYLNSENSDKKMDYAFIHEWLHVLAGRTIVHYSEEDMFPYIHIRHGFAFDTPIRRFRWLKEAITEELTRELVGTNEKVKNDLVAALLEAEIYTEERELLKLLTTAGKVPIPKELFYRAFFENYDPNDKEAIPKWKELSAKIAEAFDPSFLVRLDNAILKKGISGVLHDFKKNPNSI